MSDVTTTAILAEEQTHTEATVEAPAGAPEQALQTAEDAARVAAEQEAADRKAAEGIRKAAVAAYLKGETGYAAGLFESGRLCGEYYTARLKLGDKREAITTALRDGLTPVSSDTPDPSRLVLVYNAYALLGPVKGKCPAVLYGTYANHWARLVTRVNKDTPQESYALLPGLEEECKALFGRAVKDCLSTAAVKDDVRALVEVYAKGEADRVKAAKAEADAKAAAERKAAQEAARALQEAQEAARKAEEAQKAKSDETSARAVLEATEALQAKQRAVIEAQARAEQAERERVRADKEAKAKAEADRKAAERAAKSAAKNQAPPAPPTEKPEPAGGNLLRKADHGTPQTCAEYVVEFLTESDAPDEALLHVLRMLSSHAEMSAKAKRACQAAVVILTRKDDAKPSANGTHATAAV